MREIGRGGRVFEAAPVQGALVGAPGTGAPAPNGDGIVLLCDDESTAELPRGHGPIAAVVCTAGDDDAPLAKAAARQHVPCVMGVLFDGGPPADGCLVMVDCSGEEGVVSVVDGGVTDGGLEDVVATQSPSA